MQQASQEQSAPISSAPTQDVADEIRRLEQAAAAGRADAQADLGMRYYNGDGVAQDYNLAITLFRRAAAQGNPRGHVGLGLCYDTGRGTNKNQQSAQECFQEAANQQNAEGLFYLASSYINMGVEHAPITIKLLLTAASKYFIGAITALEALANQGFAEAQYALSKCYSNGWVVVKDPIKADEFLTKAIQANNANALYRQAKLAQEQARSNSIPDVAVPLYIRAISQGHQKTIKKIERAIEHSDKNALIIWGDCQVTGIPNITAAIKTFLAAAKLGSIQAANKIAEAATKGDAYAQYALALCYWNGWGKAKSLTDARYWLQYAVDQDCAEAEFLLGRAYEHGQLGKQKNTLTAFCLFLRAAQQGLAEAQHVVAKCYRLGICGAPKNEQQAQQWQRLANSQPGRSQALQPAVDAKRSSLSLQPVEQKSRDRKITSSSSSIRRRSAVSASLLRPISSSSSAAASPDSSLPPPLERVPPTQPLLQQDPDLEDLPTLLQPGILPKQELSLPAAGDSKSEAEAKTSETLTRGKRKREPDNDPSLFSDSSSPAFFIQPGVNFADDILKRLNEAIRNSNTEQLILTLPSVAFVPPYQRSDVLLSAFELAAQLVAGNPTPGPLIAILKILLAQKDLPRLADNEKVKGYIATLCETTVDEDLLTQLQRKGLNMRQSQQPQVVKHEPGQGGPS